VCCLSLVSYDSKMKEKITHVDCIPSDDVTIMTSSLRKVVCMFRIKFPTKLIFRIFPILRTDGMAPLGTYLWNDPRIIIIIRSHGTLLASIRGLVNLVFNLLISNLPTTRDIRQLLLQLIVLKYGHVRNKQREYLCNTFF